MDRTHIFVQIFDLPNYAERQYEANISLYGPDGELTYTGQMGLPKKRPAVTRSGGIDTLTQEAVVRYVTRNYTKQDVGMSTPMFAIFR